MSNEIPWIREEIVKAYPNFDSDGGIDLDQNGQIAANEIADANRNNFVSESEAKTFYLTNRDALISTIPFFRWGSALNIENPIHGQIHLESQLYSAEDVQKTYAILTQTLTDVKNYIASQTEDKDAIWKMMRVYLSLESQGFIFDDQLPLNYGSLFINNMIRGALDCDTGSIALLAIGYEMGWPVYGVRAPAHMFTRWENDDNSHVNFELRDGDTATDEAYIIRRSIDEHAIAEGVYMRNISFTDLDEMFFSNLAEAYWKTGNYDAALQNYDRAVALNRLDASAYYNRGSVKKNMGHFEEALPDYNKAIELDPGLLGAYVERGETKVALGRYRSALNDFQKASDIHDVCSALFFSGIAETELHHTEEANAYFTRARQECFEFSDLQYSEPSDLEHIFDEMRSREPMITYFNRGRQKLDLGEFEAAISYFSSAIESDPAIANNYFYKGLAEASLHRYDDAIADYDKALELTPSDDIYLKRGLANIRLERYEDAYSDFRRALQIDPNNLDAQRYLNAIPSGRLLMLNGQ